jgi:hypothetical protein
LFDALCRILALSATYGSHTGCGSRRLQQLGTDMAVADQADRQVAQFLPGKVGAVKVATPPLASDVPFGDEAGLVRIMPCGSATALALRPVH